jgi:hypothetical protein
VQLLLPLSVLLSLLLSVAIAGTHCCVCTVCVVPVCRLCVRCCVSCCVTPRRQHPFYRGAEASAHLSALRDVLRAYCCYNPTIGYCQVGPWLRSVGRLWGEALPGALRGVRVCVGGRAVVGCLDRVHHT